MIDNKPKNLVSHQSKHKLGQSPKNANENQVKMNYLRIEEKKNADMQKRVSLCTVNETHSVSDSKSDGNARKSGFYKKVLEQSNGDYMPESSHFSRHSKNCSNISPTSKQTPTWKELNKDASEIHPKLKKYRNSAFNMKIKDNSDLEQERNTPSPKTARKSLHVPGVKNAEMISEGFRRSSFESTGSYNIRISSDKNIKEDDLIEVFESQVLYPINSLQQKRATTSIEDPVHYPTKQRSIGSLISSQDSHRDVSKSSRDNSPINLDLHKISKRSIKIENERSNLTFSPINKKEEIP